MLVFFKRIVSLKLGMGMGSTANMRRRLTQSMSSTSPLSRQTGP